MILIGVDANSAWDRVGLKERLEAETGQKVVIIDGVKGMLHVPDAQYYQVELGEDIAETKPMYFRGTEPIRGYEDDAGLDLVVAEDVSVRPGGMAWIDLNCQVKAPHGYWLLLTGRSSTIKKRNLLVFQGIIDPGYVGPLFAGVVNLGHEWAQVKKGERIAQLIVFQNHTADVELIGVDVMPETARGQNGFGSTGS